MYAVLYASAAALLASRAYAGPGQAIIVNGCSYNVNLDIVPAAGGGHDESQKTLAPGETWSQTYTQLTNTMGWSLKLGYEGSQGVMQYEYTYNNDGTVWYDLSAVDGNPFNLNWLFSATGGYSDTNKKSPCKPNQAYYRCDNDNAWGEQSCTEDATITVTLCTSESKDSSILDEMKSVASYQLAAPSPSACAKYTPPPAGSIGGAGSGGSVPTLTANNAPSKTNTPATTTAAAAPTTHTTSPTAAAPAPSTTKAETSAKAETTHQGGNTHKQNQAEAPQPTTLTTKAVEAVVPTNGGPVEMVTETFVETATAYTTVQPQARHVHHPHHAH